MLCKMCSVNITSENVYSSDHRYCTTCGLKHTEYLKERKQTLASLREMNLESKIIQTKYLYLFVSAFFLRKIVAYG